MQSIQPEQVGKGRGWLHSLVTWLDTLTLKCFRLSEISAPPQPWVNVWTRDMDIKVFIEQIAMYGFIYKWSQKESKNCTFRVNA